MFRVLGGGVLLDQLNWQKKAPSQDHSHDGAYSSIYLLPGSYGSPNADGAFARPTAPANTRIVST
jgi:hypothetical protein